MVGHQPTGRSADLTDAVLRHAPGLHRTAVMLVGDTSWADRLVTEAFRQAAGVWGRAGPSSPAGRAASRVGPRQGERRPRAEVLPRDLLLLGLVRSYLRCARARYRDELDAGAARGDEADPGDLLLSLRPRARAAAVLTQAEGWSPRRAAEAVHLGPRSVATLARSSAGLRSALEAVADQHGRPADEVVALVLAALPGVEDPPPGVKDAAATPATVPAEGRTVRPWTWRLLAAAVALGMVVWVSALGPPGSDDTVSAPVTDPAATLPLADGTRLPTTGGDLPDRGWTLGPDGSPPVDLEGLRLVEVVPIDLRRANAPLRVDTQPRSGAAVFAVLWCDLPALDANLEVPAARLDFGGGGTTLPCAGTSGEPPVRRLVPLPPGTGPGRSTALVSWTGDVPGRGRAFLATYTESGAGPVLRESQDVAPPVAAEGSVVLDGTSPAYRVQDRPVHHLRVRIGPDTTVTAWAGGAGELAVQLDDVVVTDDGETLGAGVLARQATAWRTADPELRGGRWLAYRPGRARTFPVPGSVRPAAGQTRVVTIAVTTSLDRRSWQVHLSGAEVVGQDPTPLPLASVDAPEWIGGHRLAAAWKVPNDGIPHALVDPGLRPGRRFLLVDAPPGTELGAWGVVDPHVATTRGAAPLSVVRDVADAFDEGVWRPGDQLVRGGASTSNVLRGTGTGVLAATVPAAHGDTPPSTLLAYEPVPYDDFDFTAAPPMGVSVSAAEAAAFFGPGIPVPGAVAAGRWTSEDLDEHGRLTIDTELASRTWLRLTTQGPGRVQVLEGGRPAVWLPEGWWTSWTAEPVVTQVRVVGARGAGIPSRPFQLRVEGYEEGFVVEVLTRDGDGGAPGST